MMFNLLIKRIYTNTNKNIIDSYILVDILAACIIKQKQNFVISHEIGLMHASEMG